MIIYPAIDLRKGRCVRLRQGDPNAETVFSDDPVQMARHWESLGAEWLHIVNLDGAFSPSAPRSETESPGTPWVQRLERPDATPLEQLPINLRCLHQIRQAVEIPIQFGGGLRSLDDIELALALGADRVILGTVAAKNPKLVRWAVEMWDDEQIAVGIDARDGKVATHGWQETSELDAVDLGHCMRAMGVRRVVYTDIMRDGMLSGVNVTSTAHLGDMTDLLVIASGGVAGLADIEALKRHEHYNVAGVIVGQAIYTGQLDLPAAIAVGHRPLRRRSAGVIPYLRPADGGPIQLLLLWNSFFEQWQFPRGGVQPDEADLTCAYREFSQETGLPVLRVHEDFCTELHYMARIRNYEIERTIIYYLAETGAGEISLGCDNHSEARWVSLGEAWELLSETSPEQMPALDAASAYLSRLVTGRP